MFDCRCDKRSPDTYLIFDMICYTSEIWPNTTHYHSDVNILKLSYLNIAGIKFKAITIQS